MRLAKEGRVAITQRGQVVCVGDVGEITGPIRLRAVGGESGGAGKAKGKGEGRSVQVKAEKGAVG